MIKIPHSLSNNRRLIVGSSIILLIILVTVLAGGGLFLYRSHAWKQVEENYRKADYDAAAKSAQYLPIPKDPAEIMVYAQVMHASGNTEKAKKAYTELVDKQQDQSAMLQLGNLAAVANNPSEAIKWYEQLIAKNPTYIQAYINLAVTHKSNGDVSSALSVLNRGITNNPNASALYELKVSYLKDKKESAEYLEAVKNLKLIDPTSPELMK